METITNLKHRFYKLVSHYTKNEHLINNLWNSVTIRYAENHRAYHNFSHLEELFIYFDTYIDKLKNPDVVAFSIFYHDVVYNIWKKDNEEKSAAFAMQELENLNFPLTFLADIKAQIIATKTHHTIADDTKWLIDFDIAILGQSEEIYSNYTKKIRAEYKLIPNILYKKGRKKVLQHFIDKPFIYATDTFKESFEKQAKLNLSNELKLL